MKPGDRLASRGRDYHADWKDADFYQVLEAARPAALLAHSDGVFMCESDEALDDCGAETDWIFKVAPEGPVERHDLSWSSEISRLLGEGHAPDSPEVHQAALSYWNGDVHPDGPFWEYLTPSALILEVESSR
jgi:hypothetical protein